jgi:signal transduction histidine kinase
MRLMDLLARQTADFLQRFASEEALRQAKESAEAANVAKDNFLATLSHELRTPLTPVLATLSSWEARRSFPRELAEDLEVVRRNVDLQARLIDDLSTSPASPRANSS